MDAKIPERNKKPGVAYAVSDDGIELPVIDVTNPAFAFAPSDADIDRTIADTLADLAAFKRMTPAEIKALLSSSILLRGGLAARGSFLSGMSTYVHKLGPENLGRDFASDWDRRAAAGLLPAAFRLRLQTMAKMMAEAVRAAVTSHTGELHLIDIGGGAATSSINALILAKGALKGRTVVVHVLDIDEAGPRFGARSLEALRADRAPLWGVDAAIDAVVYDWNDTSKLRDLLGKHGSSVVAACSEGGLFSYGSDDAIAANLAVLRELAAPGFVLVAEFLMDQDTLPAKLKWIGQASGIGIRQIGLDAFRRMAEGAGWAIDEVVEGPIHHVVRLRI
jgi:hypothetical protein